MANERLLTYSNGAFTQERPEWWVIACQEASKHEISHIEQRIGNSQQCHVCYNVDADCDRGSVWVVRLPSGAGHYVEMAAHGAGLQEHATVWVPHPGDWLPFFNTYAIPYYRMLLDSWRCSMEEADWIDGARVRPSPD